MGNVDENNLLNKSFESLSDEDTMKDTVLIENDIEENDTFDDQFEEGESLVGEKYEAPAKDDKYMDVHKGVILDKKDVSPLLQIKAFLDSTNTTHKDSNKSCKKCYGRGYTGFNTTTKSWVPCSCLFPSMTKNEREAEDKKTMEKLNMMYNIRGLNKWEKRTKQKLIHQKMLELLKNKKSKGTSAVSEVKETISAMEVVNG